MEYRKRIVDEQLSNALLVCGAVLIEGPRACGKTATAMQFAGSSANLDTDGDQRLIAENAPDVFLQGATPRLIDEWQIVKPIWNHIRREVDNRQAVGQFILTGSAQSSDDSITHSGAGRILRLRMRPMSLFESGFSNGQISLGSIFAEVPFKGALNQFNFLEVIDQVCIGGWPALIDKSVEAAQAILESYLEDVVRADFSSITDVAKDPEKIRRIIRSLARNVGSEIATSRLASEVGSIDLGNIKASTVETYLDVLRGLMIVEDLPAWPAHLRSRAVVRRSLKRYFVDPSLVAAALSATPAKLLKDLNAFGFLFENLVIRDLRIYAQSFGARVFHYRDSSGLEVDAIVEDKSGAWAAFEVKLGNSEIDKAAKNLLKLASQVDESKLGTPRLLAVVTAGSASYLRPDGVAVISIGTLGP